MLLSQDESSIAAHVGERAPKLADGESVVLDQQDATEDLNNEDVPDTGTHLHLPCAQCNMQCKTLTGAVIATVAVVVTVCMANHVYLNAATKFRYGT